MNQALARTWVQTPTLSQNVSPNKRSPAQWFMYLLQLNRQGSGCLPHYLGLGRFEFDGVILTLGTGADGLSEMQVNERAQLRQELLELRETEWQELQALLAHFCANAEVKMLHLDAIVAAGCLGGDHLWRDMGFTRRAELSDFMQQNFPALAALNSQDMKWKKFLYKQLCEQGGSYVCRAPSCEQCTAFSDCFGREE